jgi:membrane protease YdiL (CAAX protease family)
MHLAPGQNLFDVALFVLTIVVLPALSVIKAVRYADSPERPRVRRYLLTVAQGWILVGLVMWDWRWSNRPLPVLGLDVPLAANGRLGLLLAGVFVVLMSVVLLNLKWLIKPARLPKLHEAMRAIKILPRTGRELNVFFLVSLTAGIWEELVYRGFLMWFAIPYTGALLAILVSAVVFALGHVYQGWRGAMQAGTIGFVFAILFVASGSLWWLMVIHAMIDVYGGVFARHISRRPDANVQPA